MKVACFMSGSGTNTRKIIEDSLKKESGYEVTLIFTDVRDNWLKKNGEKRCIAKDIAEEHGISYESIDIRDFYSSRGKKTRRDLSIRPEFDNLILQKIEPYKVDVIANAGYMSIITEPLLERYQGRILNVHPADLSITDGGSRKFVGIHTVRDAILSGEKELRATTHIVRKKVDYGEILVLSKSVKVKIPHGVDLDYLKKNKELREEIVNAHQDRLKETGDWVIYPLTLRMIAQGRFALDRGKVYIDGVLMPQGLRL